MDEEPIENNPKDLENPEKIIDEIDSALGHIKARFVEGAIHFGQEQERIQKIRPEWEKLSTTDVSDPDQAQIYASGVHALSAYRDELNDYKNMVYPITDDLLRRSPSTGGTISVTSSTTAFLSVSTSDLASYVLEPSHSETMKF